MIGNDVTPGNDLERLFCCFVLAVGACFYAIILGNISLLVTNVAPTAARHRLKKDIVNNTIRYAASSIYSECVPFTEIFPAPKSAWHFSFLLGGQGDVWGGRKVGRTVVAPLLCSSSLLTCLHTFEDVP